MLKNFVLDTNILIQDPQAIFKFEENNVYIPIFVLEEIDKFKSEPSERGRNARAVSKLLDGLRVKGSLKDGISTELGKVFIHVPVQRGNLHVALQPDSADSEIISCALEIQASTPNVTCLVTNDVNMRIRADILGLCAQAYENQSVQENSLYENVAEIVLETSDFAALYANGSIGYDAPDVYPNMCAVMKNAGSGGGSALVRYNARTQSFKLLNIPAGGVLGIKPRNKEQSFALDMLLDDSVSLVCLNGLSGSGKTLISLAAGLSKVLKSGQYNKLLLTKPVITVDAGIGFLPGSEQEKLNPFMRSYQDNLEILLMNKELRNYFSSNGKHDKNQILNMDGLLEDTVVIEALSYMRGRSLPNQFILLDECQNLNLHEIKTIITRVGVGTKIVIMGDHSQIDTKYIDKTNNGLALASNRMKGNPMVGVMSLPKGERSELASFAATVL